MMMEMIRNNGGMVPVPFHDDTIFLVEHEGQPYVPVRPIVENLGLNWPTQYRKLMAEESRWGVVIMTTPSGGGRQQTACIPLRRFWGFLNSIDPGKVNPAIRPKLEMYQAECDAVLESYWTGQMHGPTAEMEKLIEAKVGEAVDISMRVFWRKVNEEYRIAKRGAPKVSTPDVRWWRQLVRQGYTTSAIVELAKRSPSTIRKHTTDELALMRSLSAKEQGSLFEGGEK